VCHDLYDHRMDPEEQRQIEIAHPYVPRDFFEPAAIPPPASAAPDASRANLFSVPSRAPRCGMCNQPGHNRRTCPRKSVVTDGSLAGATLSASTPARRNLFDLSMTFEEAFECYLNSVTRKVDLLSDFEYSEIVSVLSENDTNHAGHSKWSEVYRVQEGENVPTLFTFVDDFTSSKRQTSVHATAVDVSHLPLKRVAKCSMVISLLQALHVPPNSTHHQAATKMFHRARTQYVGITIDMCIGWVRRCVACKTPIKDTANQQSVHGFMGASASSSADFAAAAQVANPPPAIHMEVSAGAEQTSAASALPHITHKTAYQTLSKQIAATQLLLQGKQQAVSQASQEAQAVAAELFRLQEALNEAAIRAICETESDPVVLSPR
jgi:hypothetical protein